MNGSGKTALITGASGGIGLELATLFAENGYDLVLVARSVDKLRQLADNLEAAHGISAYVLPKDLTQPTAPTEIYEALQHEGIDVEVLVNNAGFADYGAFHEANLQKQLNMIQLNITTLSHLTYLFLQGMVERGSGRILNVASTAAFQPGPLMAVYYATKSFVLSFSEATANELSGTGVTVTALCPGPTESGFQARAEMEGARLVQSGLMDARRVAEIGYEGLMAGKTTVIPGLANKVGVLATRIVPRKVTTQLVRTLHQRSGAR